METGALLSKLNKNIPGAVLEKTRFGRSEQLSVWIETTAIRQIAELLKAEPDVELDWLENISVMQLDEALVVTYLVRSSTTKAILYLRGSVVPKNKNAEVEMPSITHVWAMGEPLEREIEELFGIRFTERAEVAAKGAFNQLPAGWKGYPLRKSYEFPKEVDGILHSRPAGRSSSSKEGGHA